MPILLQVIICSLAGGVLALAGGIALAMSKKSKKLASYATAFAAGALIAAAFVDLLPEALENNDAHIIMLFAMIGLVFFFLLEGAIGWFHQHADGHDSARPINSMIVIGDTIHNFIDGVAIAAGFLVSPTSGIIVTLAVAAHEIPQEIGDFGVMLHNGVKRSRVILLNILSASVATIAAVVFFLIGSASEVDLSPLLGVVAGFFVYIAATDIIPTIHQEKSRKVTLWKSLWLIVGVVGVSLMIANIHGIAHEAGHDHESHYECEEHGEHEEHHEHNADENVRCLEK